MELLFAMDDNLTSEDGRSLNSLAKEKMLIRILFRLYHNVYLITWFYGNKNYKNIPFNTLYFDVLTILL